MFTQIFVVNGYILERVLDLGGPTIYVNIFEVVAHRFNLYRALFSYSRVFKDYPNVNKASLDWVQTLAEMAKDDLGKFEKAVRELRVQHDQMVLRDFIEPGHLAAIEGMPRQKALDVF
jgi:hypothetical protein